MLGNACQELVYKPKRPYSDRVDNSDANWSRAHNTEVARILRKARGDLGVDNAHIGAIAGVHPQTVTRLLLDQRVMKLDQFLGLVKALGLDPATVLADAADAVAKSSLQLKP